MDHTDIISVDQVSMRFALASEKVDSLKEYFIKKILHDPAGKAAAHEAMLHFFPEVMEHAITVCMDEDGVQRLYDKDGECLGEVSE